MCTASATHARGDTTGGHHLGQDPCHLGRTHDDPCTSDPRRAEPAAQPASERSRARVSASRETVLRPPTTGYPCRTRPPDGPHQYGLVQQVRSRAVIQRLTKRTPTHSDDPIATPSQSTAHSPPTRKSKHSRERRRKSPARRRRGLAVIRAGKQPSRHRRQSTPTTDTSIAEAE